MTHVKSKVSNNTVTTLFKNVLLELAVFVELVIEVVVVSNNFKPSMIYQT